jgi:Fe-S cluster assembly iron-binding protein IscA
MTSSTADSTQVDAVLEITEEALGQIVALRDEENIEGLALGIRISGVTANGFTYETAFVRPEDVLATDHVEEHGDLRVAITLDSVDNLRGSVLDVSSDPNAPGLVLRNPNQPSPAAPWRNGWRSSSTRRSTRPSPLTAGTPGWCRWRVTPPSSSSAGAARAAGWRR